jgi:hypothetical protein
MPQLKQIAADFDESNEEGISKQKMSPTPKGTQGS